MSLSRNIVAGVVNSAWSALIGVAVVPLYLKYLGIEAYGLVGFFATTQAVLSLLDLGLAPTMNREVARCSASGNVKEASVLLHTLAVVYWAMAALIALIIFSFAPIISQYWLQSKHIPQETVSHAVMLMGLVAAARWPIGLYQGAVMGAQRLTVSSGVSITMTTIGNLGAIGILAFVSPTIQAFFIWQASVGLLYAMTMRWAAWRIIGRLGTARFDTGKLKNIWLFSAGMSGITLSGLVFTQLDKIMLSKMLGLEEFAKYMLATVVANSLYVVIMPAFNIVYPRLSMLVATGDDKKLIELYRLGTRMLATVLFPLGMLLAVFSKELVMVWTHNQDIATHVSPIISLLVTGSALNGIMFFPYALQLAHGMTRIPLTINMILMCLLIPLVYILAKQFSATGGAMAWLITEASYVMLGTWLTHRYLLKGLAWEWLLQDVGVPLLLSILTGVIGYLIAPSPAYSIYERLMGGISLAILALAGSLLLSPQLRSVIRHFGQTRQHTIR